LRDRIASLLVSKELDEAVRLNAILVKRFPASTAIAQAKGYFTAAYCLGATPRPQLTVQDWAIAKKLYETEPCRRMAFAANELILPNTMLELARGRADNQSDSDRRSAAYMAQQRQESAAYWGSVLGVVTGVIANSAAQSANSSTYAGAAAGSSGHRSTAAPGAYPGSSGSVGGGAIAGPLPATNTPSNPGMFRVDPATRCAQYMVLPQGPGGWKYYQISNACNYAIHVNVLAEGDGREAHTRREEIGPYATLKSRHGVLAQQMIVTIRAVCPGKAKIEATLGKRVTGVYSQQPSGFGCWSMLESTGVGRAN
jgi:hypothetical protein